MTDRAPSSVSASSRAASFPGDFSSPRSTARELQFEIGGEIVFFFHDSDHDWRETRTTLRHPQDGRAAQLNFAFENQMQRKFSPLYLKRVRSIGRPATPTDLPVR